MTSRATPTVFLTGLFILPFLAPGAVVAQETPAYVSRQHNVSFRPPPGWTTDILVQYVGPERADDTRPALNLAAQNSQLDLSEQGLDSLSKELAQEFGDARLLDRRRITIAGMDALQIELSYLQGDVPMRMRQVYVPVAEQSRTYLFTFVDTTEHFDETVGAATTAMSSFAVTRSSGSDSPGEGSNVGKAVLLVLTGIVSLVLIIGAAYLLLRRQRAQ